MSGVYRYCRGCKVYRPTREFTQRVEAKCRSCKPPVTEQRCVACGFVQAIEEFHRDRKARTGRRRKCRSCRNADFRHWHHEQRHQPSSVGERLARLISSPWSRRGAETTIE